MSYPTISGFYQCYKEPKALFRTLNSFRHVYPNSTVELISDGGGYDYTKIAEYFNVNYQQLEKRTGDVANSTVFSNRENFIDWLSRLVEAAKKSKEEYIILLEDDVVVLKKIQSPLLYDINGANTHEFLGKKMEDYLHRIGKKAPKKNGRFFYGGCGGSLFRRDFLITYLSNPEVIGAIITELEPYREGRHLKIYSTDYWISLLTYYVGGTVGSYEGFCEKWERNYWWRKNVKKNIEVLHQAKDLYGKSLTKEEKQLFGDKMI